MSELAVEKRQWTRGIKNMTPEELKEYKKYYNSRRINRTRKNIPIKHCDVCNCDITWDNMSKHVKTNKHKNNDINHLESTN